jgi:hypothetical protein
MPGFFFYIVCCTWHTEWILRNDTGKDQGLMKIKKKALQKQFRVEMGLPLTNQHLEEVAPQVV